MNNFLLNWVWQFPQMLAGFILVKRLKAEKRRTNSGITYYSFKRDTKFGKFISGVSLGQVILLPVGNIDDISLKHEYGHSIQSKYLGWFYLLAVGIYSAVFCNLWDRRFHKNWNSYDRLYWYYKTRWCESWADKLGEVDRDRELKKTYRPLNSRYPTA